MDFLTPEMDQYIEKHIEAEPEALYELNRHTYLKVLNPRMIAGHLQGRVISMISHMIKPKNVLEIGTYTGYSALCWAEGIEKGGKIVTIDINEELQDFVKEQLTNSKYKDSIEFLIGNALDIVPTLDIPFDIVYIDADKTNYHNYYDLLIDRIPSGAYIIADNVLWSGKVLNQSHDADTEAIKAFNIKVNEDPRVQNVLFPIRDGLMICRKK